MVKTPLRIGVLALQGGFREHVAMVRRCGAEAVEIRRPLTPVTSASPRGGLDELDGMILPGGESTSIGNLLEDWGLMEPMRLCGREGLPLYGSCAGLILLCARIENDNGEPSDQPRLGLLNAVARRNAFGRQAESFLLDLRVEELEDASRPMPAVFIRAPVLRRVGSEVRRLACLPPAEPDGEPRVVAARQGNLLVTAFHPELTGDARLHRYFLNMATARSATR